MVEEIKKTYYKCEKCGLIYKNKETAEKCQAWCTDNPGTCDPAVSKEAVQLI